MGQFSADLFLKLAKTADTRGELGGETYDDPVFAKTDFGPKGKAQIEDFKNAVFMILMMRARAYMNKTGQHKMSAEDRRAFTSFGIMLFDQDVHEGSSSTEKQSLASITGVIGNKMDMFALDDNFLQSLVQKLFVGEDGYYDPTVKLACTNS